MIVSNGDNCGHDIWNGEVNNRSKRSGTSDSYSRLKYEERTTVCKHAAQCHHMNADNEMKFQTHERKAVPVAARHQGTTGDGNDRGESVMAKMTFTFSQK